MPAIQTPLSLPPGPLWMVDDEVELVHSTVAMLARELGSTRVRGATDSREVASWIEQERPAALITDVRMPHVTGLELVTRLHQKWGPVPVVVITAFPTTQVDQQANAGCFAYLPKPFSFRSLRDTLARLCAQPAPSAFSGAIAVSMLDEVVQLYGLASRTGTLRVISSEGTGEIGFDTGRVVDARTPSAVGVAAFNVILRWKSGSFSWQPGTPQQTTIELGLSELLLEAYRLRDEGAHSPEPEDDGESDPFQGLELDSDGPRPLLTTAPPTGNNLLDNLSKLELADGFLGAAVFDTAASACVAAVDASASVRAGEAASGHADLVRAKRQTVAELAPDDELEDIIFSLRSEYHLLRLCRRQPSVFLYLALDRSKANLAIARHLLSDVERDMVL